MSASIPCWPALNLFTEKLGQQFEHYLWISHFKRRLLQMYLIMGKGMNAFIDWRGGKGQSYQWLRLWCIVIGPWIWQTGVSSGLSLFFSKCAMDIPIFLRPFGICSGEMYPPTSYMWMGYSIPIHCDLIVSDCLVGDWFCRVWVKIWGICMYWSGRVVLGSWLLFSFRG